MNGQMQGIVNKTDRLSYSLEEMRNDINALKRRVNELERGKARFDPKGQPTAVLIDRCVKGDGPEWLGFVGEEQVFAISEKDLEMYEECWEKVHNGKV